MIKAIIFAIMFGLVGWGAYEAYTAPAPAEPKTYIERYRIERIFEHEGCRMYRFWDNNNNRYFASCSGGTWWTENCGKGCRQQVEVPSAVRP